jgi:hypothetical protein
MSLHEWQTLIWFIQKIDDAQIDEKKLQKFLGQEIQNFAKI